MLGINRWRSVARTLLISGLLICVLNLWGCGGDSRSEVPKTRTATARSSASKASPVKLAGKISEVSPPEVIQELRTVLEQYEPQVTIVAPRPNEMLQDDTVSVRLQVKDLPLFKDEKLGLGPHLHLFLDNQPYQAIYDVSQPIVLKDLSPGTHTLRAFAGRPWHESFKNEGAYAQTTFHVFTKTPDNNPNPDLPLLTYSRPQATYGAEPIMLDFFLTNAPLHIVAQEDEKDDVADWRIKVTVNGSEFVLDRWQPLYLKGFTPGKNWVQLEYIDEKGNPVQNVYNNTARSFTYTPNGKDTLSKLVRNELSVAQARSIVDSSYKVEAPESSPEPSPVPTVVPVLPSPVKPAIEEPTPKIEPSEPPKSKESQPVEEPQGGFFNRFRRSSEPAKPSPSATPEAIPSVLPEPTPSVAPVPTEPIAEPAPELEDKLSSEESQPLKEPQSGFFNRFRRSSEPAQPTPSATPEAIPSVLPESTPSVTPVPVEPIEEPAPKLEEDKPSEVQEPPKKGFFDRFRRPESPKPSPAITPEPTVSVPPELGEPTTESAPEIPETKAPEVEVPKAESKPNFYERFRRPSETPKPSPSETPAPLNKIEEPTPEPTETKPSDANPQLKTELERRLGIPLTSPKPTSLIEPSPPAAEVKPAEVEQPAPADASDIKPLEPQQTLSIQSRKPPNPFRRPSNLIEPSEAPIKLPETLEAPSDEPTPIRTVQ